MRFRLLFACALLACAAASLAARAESASPASLSHGDLKKMMREAHTSEDYLTLASYFRWRQQQFAQQAHEELVFWAQRSSNVSLQAAKYPRPADSSKNRYDYFQYEAQKMSQRASNYEALSGSANR